MSLKQDLAANRWLRAQFAVLMLAVVYVPVVAVLSLTFGTPWVLAPVPAYAAAGGVCWVGARRESRVLNAAKMRRELEARELRTPRVPDAAPDQCPVCGGFGLDVLAKDDEFMERGPDRAKVVAYGTRRAHWDCAEVVPHKAAVGGRVVESGDRMFLPKGFEWASRFNPERLFTGPDGKGYVRYAPAPVGSVLCTCRFCGEQQHSPDMATGEARLIAHARACRERARVAAAERAVAARPSWMSASEARVLADIEEAAAAPCRPTGAANAAWCERQTARVVEEARRRWQA